MIKTAKKVNVLSKLKVVLLRLLYFYFTINCYKNYTIVPYANTFIKYFSKNTNILSFWADLYSVNQI